MVVPSAPLGGRWGSHGKSVQDFAPEPLTTWHPHQLHSMVRDLFSHFISSTSLTGLRPGLLGYEGAPLSFHGLHRNTPALALCCPWATGLIMTLCKQEKKIYTFQAHVNSIQNGKDGLHNSLWASCFGRLTVSPMRPVSSLE